MSHSGSWMWLRQDGVMSEAVLGLDLWDMETNPNLTLTNGEQVQ